MSRQQDTKAARQAWRRKHERSRMARLRKAVNREQQRLPGWLMELARSTARAQARANAGDFYL